jgi:hypothetical protein
MQEAWRPKTSRGGGGVTVWAMAESQSPNRRSRGVEGYNTSLAKSGPKQINPEAGNFSKTASSQADSEGWKASVIHGAKSGGDRINPVDRYHLSVRE